MTPEGPPGHLFQNIPEGALASARGRQRPLQACSDRTVNAQTLAIRSTYPPIIGATICAMVAVNGSIAMMKAPIFSTVSPWWSTESFCA